MLRYYYLTWFSQPAADRTIYQAVHPRHVQSIVEIGIGQGVRTKRLFELAVKPEHAETPLQYTGIDLFEARDRSTLGLSLKQAHQTLQTEHVKLRFVPGDPLSALSRCANTVGVADVVIISADQSGPALDAAWRYMPRIANEQTLVYRERPAGKGSETKFELVPYTTIQKLAAESHKAFRRVA
jgi:hypothetical protein